MKHTIESKNILKQVKEDKVAFIELQFTDIFGTLKSIEIPVGFLEAAFKRGVWFDGSSIRGFARLKESDMYLVPDISTYGVLPGNSVYKTARFFCDVYTPEHKPFDGSPRQVLKNVMKEAEELGYYFKTGPEVEFYLFEKDNGSFKTPRFDTGSYFDSSTGDVGSNIRKEIMVALKSIGIESERAHHEVGPGQHEIGFRYDNPLITADRVVTLKKVIKSIAHKYGFVASFMPKPIFGQNGSGMHVHFSLFDKLDKPLFYDAKDPNKLSKLAKHFISGLLEYATQMSAIFSPSVSSYKRLVAGYEAPIYICWGCRNRSSLVRIPQYTKGKESSVRGELRCPDPGASPYLVFAAMLKAGLAGIKEKMKLGPELEDSVFDKSGSELKELGILPSSLTDAVKMFRTSLLMQELLGEELFEKYADAKEKEADEFRTAVTEWEINRYLESS